MKEIAQSFLQRKKGYLVLYKLSKIDVTTCEEEKVMLYITC